MSWDKWQDLGEIPGAPAVVALKVGEFDVFATNANGHLVHKKYENGKFDVNWADLGIMDGNVPLVGAPAVVKWAGNRIDCLARGTDNKLHHTVINGNHCDPWSNLGGGLSSSPSAAAWVGNPGAPGDGSRNRLYAFTRGTNDGGQAGIGYPWFCYWDGSWKNWDGVSVGKYNIIGAPAAVCWGPNRIDVFVHWQDNSLRHTAYDNGKWESFDADWNKLGGSMNDSPAAASWGTGRLDVFVRDAYNNMSRRTWVNGSWQNWESFGGELSASPAVYAAGPNHIDCLARSSNGRLYYRVVG